MDKDYLGSPQALVDLKALNARFIHNFVTNDVPSHDAILHPLFTAIQSSGARVDRATYLDRWKTGFHPDVIPYWDVRDEEISIFGAIALVRATNKYVIKRRDLEITGMTRYTDVYVFEAGTWKCIQAQITPVQPEHQPSDDTVVTVYIAGVKQ